MIRTVALLSLLATAFAPATAGAAGQDDVAPPRGTICFQGAKSDCSATAGMTFNVAPSTTARRFVWTSEDGVRVVAGSVAPNQATLDLADQSLREVTLSLTGSRARGWPVDVRMTLERGKTTWDWIVPAKSVTKLRSISVAPDDYALTLAAAHHRGNRGRFHAQKNVALGEIALRPLPAISGRVVQLAEGRETGVAGAQILRGDGKLHATADEQGAFHSELSEPFPNDLLVVHPGLATRVIALGQLQPEKDLGVIRLERGVTIALHVKRPDAIERQPIGLQLFHRSEQHSLAQVAERQLKAGEADAVFNDISAGHYVLLASGGEPMARLSTDIDVTDADVQKEIRIAPFRLEGSVRLGETTLHDGTIDISDRDQNWRQELPIGTDGRFTATMWQDGTVRGWVKSKDLGGSGMPVTSPALGADPSSWDISFKRRFIAGRVTDEESGAPIAEAEIRLEFSHGRSNLYTSVVPDTEGTYSILATEEGTYDLTVSARDRMTTKATVQIAEQDESRKVDFVMSRGIETGLDVVWATGGAVAGAQVLDGVARDGHNAERYYRTDGAGHVTLRMKRDETRTLAILPHEGSFAIAHVIASSDKGEKTTQHVMVPPPVGSLNVTVRDANGELAFGAVVMRYNGEWIPFPASGRLRTERAGKGQMRIQQLPAGVYELWAVNAGQGPGQAARATAGPPLRSPLTVSLTAGEKDAELTAGPGAQ